MYKQKFYNEKSLQLQITNSLIHSHDLACDCNDGIFHSAKLILQQVGKEFTYQQKAELKRCLGDGTVATTTTEEDDLGGDLEKLFAADAEDPDG